VRALVILLLLIVAHYANSSAVLCPDGLTNVNNNTALCPVNSTSQSVVSIAQTTAAIQATADAQAAGSTGYHWTAATQFPAGCTSLNYTYSDLSSGVTATRQAAIKARQKCMNWKTMVAGTGAVSYGFAAISVAGVYTVPITGLTASTTYYTQHFVMGGVGGAGKVGVLSTQQFATNSSGASPGETYVEDAGAAPRYIGTGGNDSSDGLTHATRWLDPEDKVSCAYPAGTNIAYFNTSTFNLQKVTICHGGTAVDRNIVGSYKLNGSSVPIWTVDGTMGPTTADEKAEFLGGLTQGCLDAGSCDFSNTFPVDDLANTYDCAFQVTSAADYTTLQNIAINKVRWCPFSAKGDSNSNRNLTNFIADGIDLEDNGDGHMHLFFLTGAVIKNFAIERANTCYQQRSKSGHTGSTTGCPGAWGGAMPVIGSRQVLLETNWADDTFGEVYQPFSDNQYIIIRGNYSGNSLTVCIYGDSSSYTVIENNICNLVQPDANIGYSTQVAYRTAIESNMEYYGSSVPPPGSNDYVTVRNNLVLNAATGSSNEQYAQIISSDPGVTRKSSGYLNGNIFINATSSAIRFWVDNNYDSTRVPFYYAKNNVVWSPDLGAYACQWRQVHSSVDITYTHWDATQILDTDCNGTGDSTGDPGLVVSNINTWKAYTALGTPATFANARPDVGSALANSGVAAESVVYTWADFGVAATSMADYVSGAITAEHWVKERYYSATNEVLGATPPKGPMCPLAGC